MVEEQEVHAEENAVPSGGGWQVAQPGCCECVGQSVYGGLGVCEVTHWVMAGSLLPTS